MLGQTDSSDFIETLEKPHADLASLLDFNSLNRFVVLGPHSRRSIRGELVVCLQRVGRCCFCLLDRSFLISNSGTKKRENAQ